MRRIELHLPVSGMGSAHLACVTMADRAIANFPERLFGRDAESPSRIGITPEARALPGTVSRLPLLDSTDVLHYQSD